jgi:hypothetical protein
MQLSLQRAEQIIEQYADALAREIPENGIARYESWLPCRPEIVAQAIKIICALDIQSKYLTQEARNNYGTAISSLSSFVPDEVAKRINATRNLSAQEKFEQHNSDALRELDSFRDKKDEGLNLRIELENFIADVEQIDPKDPLYYQRAYTLAGAEYLAPSKKRHFWQIFSGVA